MVACRLVPITPHPVWCQSTPLFHYSLAPPVLNRASLRKKPAILTQAFVCVNPKQNENWVAWLQTGVDLQESPACRCSR